MRFSTSAVLVLAAISVTSCKQRSADHKASILSTTVIPRLAPMDSTEGALFTTCSNAGNSGGWQLDIHQDKVKKTALLRYRQVKGPNDGGEDTELVSARGTLESPNEAENYQFLYSFQNLSFLITLDRTNTGFYLGTLAGRDSGGNEISEDLMCELADKPAGQ